MAPTEHELRDIAARFLEAFRDLSAEDHLALRAPECLQIFAPSSLNMSPTKTNEEFAEHLKGPLSLVLSHFPVIAKEVYINVGGRQATIWATAIPEFKPEAMGSTPAEEWKYQGEYIFILDVNEEGKITRILEFLDSLGTQKLRGMFKKARENIGQDGHGF